MRTCFCDLKVGIGFSDGVFVFCFPVSDLDDFWGGGGGGGGEVLSECVLKKKKFKIFFVFLFFITLQCILF